jgi:hypothetical protein
MPQFGADQFITLMLAQIKNQDPLKPLEPAEFLGQLAQFSTVTGIQEMGSSVSDLVGSMRSSQALSGANLVGRDVLAPGDTAVFDGTTPVRAATFSTQELVPGDEVWTVGLRADQRIAVLQSRVASVGPVAFPLSRTLGFRDSNLEVVQLVNGPADFDGVIADKSGTVRALWSSFAFEAGRELQQQNLGVPAEIVTEMVELVRSGRPLQSLEAELAVVPLAAARRFGLGDFDEAEIREELDAPDRAALEVAFVVEHADDVAGIDALVLADAEEELHHAGLGAFAGLGAGLAFEIALAASGRGVAGLPSGAALGVVATFGALWAIFPGTAFAAVVRSRLAVFRDLFTLASVGVAK